MTEHERETAFLRRAILFDDSGRRRKIVEGIAQIQRDVHCVQRAVALMTLAGAVVAAGFFYGAVLEENFPHGMSPIAITVLCVTGLTSAISLTGLSGLWIIYRWRLNRLREQCRQLVTNLLESRQQKSYTDPVDETACDFI